MEEVRSAAAQAGYVDVEKLIHHAAQQFATAESCEQLDEIWRQLVRPVYNQLSEDALAILSRLFNLNLSLLDVRKP